MMVLLPLLVACNAPTTGVGPFLRVPEHPGDTSGGDTGDTWERPPRDPPDGCPGTREIEGFIAGVVFEGPGAASPGSLVGDDVVTGYECSAIPGGSWWLSAGGPGVEPEPIPTRASAVWPMVQVEEVARPFSASCWVSWCSGSVTFSVTGG